MAEGNDSVLVVRQQQQQQRQVGKSSVWPLVFYTLSVIVVCLTGFNFYLFCWVWSSLSASTTNSGSLIRSGQWAPMDALSSWDSIKLKGKLSSFKELQVEKILANNEQESISLLSKNSVQLLMNHQRKRPVIEVSAERRRIQLASGLKVVGSRKMRSSSDETKKEPQIGLTCDSKTASCLLDSTRIQLNNLRGVDFNRKSVQTPKVATKRLHSPTNWLNLLSTNISLFESKAGSIYLAALDELSLFSHNSAVILNAETIDVSRIRGFGNGGRRQNLSPSTRGGELDYGGRKWSSANRYKLCVCLLDESMKRTPSGGVRGVDQWNVLLDFEGRKLAEHNDGRMGSVFAIKPKLNCSSFSESFCNKSLQ